MSFVDLCPSDCDEPPVNVKPNLKRIRSIAHPDSCALLYGRHAGPNDRGIIYVGVCVNTDKMYVGRHRHSKDGRSWAKTRLSTHKRQSGCWLLYHSLKKYEFEWYVLEELPADILNEQEVHWIADLKTQHPNGYNIDAGGAGGPDSWSEATKQKRKNTMAMPESKAKRSNLTAGQWASGQLRSVHASAAEKRLVATLEEANRLAVPDVPNKQRVHNAYYRIGEKIFRFRKIGRGQLREMSREAIEAERRAKKEWQAAKRKGKE